MPADTIFMVWTDSTLAGRYSIGVAYLYSNEAAIYPDLDEHRGITACRAGRKISTILFSNALADQAKVETRRIRAELEKLVSIRTTDLETRTAELEFALENIKSLKGLIPICASCKNVRDDHGFWTQVELYIRDRSEAEFSHGICPACAEKLYGEYKN